MYTSSQTSLANPNLERLTDKLNVTHYEQVFTGSRPKTSPFSVRRIQMSGITEEYPVAPQYNTFKEKQFIFFRIKESAMPGWKALFWKRPKGPNNCNGLERPSPPGQQFTCQPGYLGGKAVTTNRPLNAQAASFGTIAGVQMCTDTMTN